MKRLRVPRPEVYERCLDLDVSYVGVEQPRRLLSPDIPVTDRQDILGLVGLSVTVTKVVLIHLCAQTLLLKGKLDSTATVFASPIMGDGQT